MLTKYPASKGGNGKVRSTERSTERSSDGTEAAFRALLRTCGLMRRVMEPYFSRFGISGSQWGVLRVLNCAEKNGERSIRLTDLSERLLIQPPSVTGVVDRLERLSLVKRSAERGDLRAKRVSLTHGGRTMVKQVLEVHAAKMRSVLGGLTAAERKELWRLLDRVDAHLEAALKSTGHNGNGESR